MSDIIARLRGRSAPKISGQPGIGDLIYRSGGAALIGVIVVWVFFAIANPHFLTMVNQANIGRQMAVVAIVSIGMTVVIMSGGIDLSVGSIIGLAGTLLASAMVQASLDPVVGTLVALAAGIAIGLLNGVLVAYLRVPPIVATLATLSIARGIALTYTNGLPLSGIAETYSFLGRGNLGPIPVSVIAMLILYAIIYVLLRNTSPGRHRK